MHWYVAVIIFLPYMATWFATDTNSKSDGDISIMYINGHICCSVFIEFDVKVLVLYVSSDLTHCFCSSQMQIYMYNSDDFDSLSAALREKRIIAAMSVFFQVGTFFFFYQDCLFLFVCTLILVFITKWLLSICVNHCVTSTRDRRDMSPWFSFIKWNSLVAL